MAAPAKTMYRQFDAENAEETIRAAVEELGIDEAFEAVETLSALARKMNRGAICSEKGVVRLVSRDPVNGEEVPAFGPRVEGTLTFPSL